MDKYYYEYKDDGDVKYCYPGTQVLVNKLDIHDGQQLSVVEREISIVKDETDKEFVSKKIAYYLSELNVIHPFREGNGRTQRIYCQQLCMNTGKFYLDFSMADEGEMLEASVDSFMCDYEKMEDLIRRCIKEME